MTGLLHNNNLINLIELKIMEKYSINKDYDEEFQIKILDEIYEQITTIEEESKKENDGGNDRKR